ncbi:D-aminoacyl-tRNA deacylase [Sulfobacillus harzensis]|uniref:D-aminoacyl-tRNA deacylase n=1 Tax=Sulfobacillus harzensis TaxID=2729629 RepID=A0A7Y0Q2M4_9FIRM|nr:D-tyrosyl-tRNA(Tyr) deacylase [Sulfobacillus harzensis]
MRAVVQRVREAAVTVEGAAVGAIGVGLLVLLGVSESDTEREMRWLADKVAGLRIFPDQDDKMSRSLSDVDGSLLVVSQFTLYGSVRRGLRPDFQRAAGREAAEALYEAFSARCRSKGIRTETGAFGAHMMVSLVNWGPVTLILDTDEVMVGGE